MNQPNATLAYEVLDHILANPEEWYQDDWVCGSGMCFAGHAAVLSGWRYKGKYPCVVKGEKEYYIPAAAKHELGIEHSHRLFCADNTIRDLIRRVGEVFGPDPRPKGRTTQERLEEVEAVA